MRQHNSSTGDRYANLRNGVARSLSNGTSAVLVLSEVVNALQDEQLAHDEDSPDMADNSHLSEMEEFQSLTTPHADNSIVSDEEETSFIQFIDETQALGRMAAEISSNPPSVAVSKKRNVRFADQQGFGKGA